MHISSENASKLELAENAWFSYAMAAIIIIAFLGMGILIYRNPSALGDFRAVIGLLGLFLFGVFLAATAERWRVIFDKNKNKVTIIRQGIFGKTTDSHEISEIKRVLSFQKTVKTTFLKNDYTQIKLMLDNGKLVPITPQEERSISFNFNRQISGAERKSKDKRVAEFIGVPIEYAQD